MVGITTVFVDLICYTILILISLDTYLAKGASFLVGTVFAYFANRKITFRVPSNSQNNKFFYFLILYLTTLFINVSINEFVLNFSGHDISSYALAFICATSVSASINFFGMKFFVFNKKKKIFFSKEFFPKHSENQMESEGDIAGSRNIFLQNRFNNLDYLLKQRYKWMNHYLKPEMKIVEVGCGGGLSELYLSEKVLLTDAANNEWVEKYIDATDMDFESSSIDIIIASHTIHHFYNPAKFFSEVDRVLKRGGLLLISEINTSLLMRVILKLMKHEGYSYDVDVFNYQTICNDKTDLWSANCAIPELLFGSEEKFHSFFSRLEIESQKYTECSIFPLSGGVVSKKNIFEIPTWILEVFNFIDKILIFCLPNIFAFGRKVVIRKR
ncbi:GtrA family protein [Candidatus Pseudothioglobus singularis]|nr:GtrA family protein [Candidatus Pseudothioglobus singularis]